MQNAAFRMASICSAVFNCHLTIAFADNFDQYQVVKSAMMPLARTAIKGSLIRDTSSRSFSLMHCEWVGMVDSPPPGSRTNQITRALKEVAFNVSVTELRLENVGYPQPIWKNIVEQYEKKYMQLAIRHDLSNYTGYVEFYKALAVVLNRYRSTLPSNKRPPRALDTLHDEGGCGDGGAETAFKTSPPNGRIFMITAFDYALCSARGIDPTDMISCEAWTEVHAGQYFLASGKYKYKLIFGKNNSNINNFTAMNTDERRTITLNAAGEIQQ